MDRDHPTGRTLAGTFEAREGDLRCALVVTLDDRGALHGHVAFGPLRLWLRGAHANRGRLGVGLLGVGHEGAPLAWVRLRTLGDQVLLDLDPSDGGDAPRSSRVVFGRRAGDP